MFGSSLDNLKEYTRYDKNGVYETISRFSDQFESGWHQAEFLQLSFDPEKIKNVVYVGMGASNLAGKIIHSLSAYLLDVPFEVVSNYRLPAYSKKSTLVILSSYSGHTQEVISAGMDGLARGTKIVCLSTGGQLQKLAEDNHLPFIKLDPKFNICHSPRLGLIQSLAASLGLIQRLKKEGGLNIDLKEMLSTINKALDYGNRHRDLKVNPAKSLAQSHQQKGIILIAANHLYGVADSVKNYLNESAKTFSVSYSLPDLNHHLLDGLTYPSDLKNDLRFILINSQLYPQIIQKRILLTQDTLIKQGYQVTTIKPESENPFSQVLESLVFFTWFSYYLSIANKVDPSTNPWVDYFKKYL